ncbi:hypothetical protein C8Q80DRAFT_1109666, partial [Daedaleopsis nitida]
WGKGTDYTTQYTATYIAKAAPHETLYAQTAINMGTVEVPFTLYFKAKSSGLEVQTTGLWSGSTSWNFRHIIIHWVE